MGCSTNVNRKAFAACRPKSVGIVLGYDLHTVSQSANEEFLVSALFGLVGAVVNEVSLDKQNVENNAQVNSVFIDATVSQLEAKGYSPTVLAVKGIEYDTFKNGGGKPEDFERLMEQYEVASAAEHVDAVLFVEGYFEFGYLQPEPEAPIDMETVKTKVAEVRTQMFDMNTKQRLFKQLSALADTRNLDRVANHLIHLKKIPAAPE